MAETFYAQILTPDGKLFEGDATAVQVPGRGGSFEIKKNHAPIISTLDIGHIRVERENDEVLYFAVSRGFVEMNDNHLTLLAEVAESIEDIDVERALRAKERALEQLFTQRTDRFSVESSLKRAENRLRLIEEQG